MSAVVMRSAGRDRRRVPRSSAQPAMFDPFSRNEGQKFSSSLSERSKRAREKDFAQDDGDDALADGLCVLVLCVACWLPIAAATTDTARSSLQRHSLPLDISLIGHSPPP